LSPHIDCRRNGRPCAIDAARSIGRSFEWDSR
jgi:hypothetical protein